MYKTSVFFVWNCRKLYKEPKIVYIGMQWEGNV